ncbi:elongation factor G [Solidesulfovibrio sp.]|jgi:elongation factor G|uniref:elongation factor G n=1 Tax=Solidesulfovibrio sp. TaxID=2910990 RepID=UPI002B20B08D|nr:elongation factor G [Solidesulfovibrio sp.]MEA5090300.1 elongation factor G [Solidesulfovibrio sp.]HML61013.1 elongation factor G [Solidesulfovibrio sp.]
MSDNLASQRTYALIGHGGCGKTSVAEMLLFTTGAVGRLGKIEEGTTALDYEPEEIKRRGSTQPGLATYQFNKNRHFLLDVPGDGSFNGDLPFLLRAVDGVVFVVDAVDGVKPLTKKLWGEVVKLGLPAVFFINKMDRDRADFDMALSGIREKLGVKTYVQNLPIGAREAFTGVVNVLEGKAYLFDDKGGVTEGPIPDDMADEVETLRETMVEEIAVADEQLMERYLEGEEISTEELLATVHKATLSGQLCPVCCGSALKNMGGGRLLAAVQNFLPGPLEGADGPKTIATESGDIPVSESGPVVAFVFKTLFDPFAGQLSMTRVLTGTLNTNQDLQNPVTDTLERAGQILLPLGKETVISKEPAGPGSIVALAKLKDTATGNTLCDPKKPVIVPAPVLPPPMISYALAPAEKGDEDKVFAAMTKLLDEDITLSITRDEETGDILLSGMGQTHLETAVEKAKRRFKVSPVLKAPKIPYRESVKGKVEVQGRHKKQTGGRGQFGDCWIRMEGQARGAGYEFVDAIVGGAIPRQYIPAVDKGVVESAARGYVAGYPMVDFKVTLYDGSFHTVDSSEMAFKIAGSIAFKAACEKLKISLLEPIVLVSVSCPDEYMGDIIGDLSSRRGKVLGSDSTGGITEIQAHVPMAEMQEYAKTLSSMTGGQGAFTMAFDHYEECPPPIAEKVIAESRKKEE